MVWNECGQKEVVREGPGDYFGGCFAGGVITMPFKHEYRSSLAKLEPPFFLLGIYDLDNNLIEKFNNNADLARHLKISRTTVGRYIKTGKAFKKLYYFKINNKR